MRRTGIIALAAVLVLGLALSSGASADVSVLGSLAITGTKTGGGAITPDDLVGFVVIANPGLEKTLTQQIPPLTVPVFLAGQNGPGGVFNPSVDTLVVLTNPSGTLTLSLMLTVFNQAGTTTLATKSLTLAPHETQFVRLSGLL